MVIGPSILIVEDDAVLRGNLGRGLREDGFDVHLAATGGEALEVVRRIGPDALVIDIGLPDADGRDVCQALRASGVDAPILFLTARDALTDLLSGFHAGGDDYLTKPFAFTELVVRLRALLRRTGRGEEVVIAGLHLNPASHEVTGVDGTVGMTPTEFRLLAALASRAGRPVRRRELIATAWPDGAIVHDNTLDAYVSRIRRKLRGIGHEAAIDTVHGVGYRLG